MSGDTVKAPTPEQGQERVLIVKVHHARLASQSEQFANELTRHLGICAPECRILRKVVHRTPHICCRVMPHLQNVFNSALEGPHWDQASSNAWPVS